jgi:uncharacterized membrane protein YeaQ/YmgE (transglycosylase-associated protein family)
MYLLLWISVGLLAGWLVGRSLEGNGYGPSMDLAMGAGGAVVGGFLMRSIDSYGHGGTILTTFMAVCCAALLTIVAGLANGRAIHTRAL